MASMHSNQLLSVKHFNKATKAVWTIYKIDYIKNNNVIPKDSF